MDTYVLQRYFKSLCQTHHQAYQEIKRILRHGKADAEVINELRDWEILLNSTEAAIDRCIAVIRKNNAKVIISSEAEVYSIIGHYTYDMENEDFDFLNVDKRFEALLPNNDVCRRFMKAYREKDHTAMLELYDETYVKEI